MSIPLSNGGGAPPSVILSPETSLLTLPNFVPPGFKCGVEVLNDDATPMEFVVSMLSAHWLCSSAHTSSQNGLDVPSRCNWRINGTTP
jgi:hypothetical protein